MTIAISYNGYVVSRIRHAPFRLNKGDRISYTLLKLHAIPASEHYFEDFTNKEIYVKSVYVSESFDLSVQLELK